MILMMHVCFHYQVFIGNLRMSLGRLSLIHQERLNLTGNKTLIPSVLILFFFVLLSIGITCMRKNRIGPFKRKIIHHESSVVFHADTTGQQVSRRLMPDPDPESSTSARLNGNLVSLISNIKYTVKKFLNSRQYQTYSPSWKYNSHVHRLNLHLLVVKSQVNKF